MGRMMRYSLRVRILTVMVGTLVAVVASTAAVAWSIFYSEYTGALRSTASVIAQNQGQQFNRILDYGIRAEDVIGFDVQTAETRDTYSTVSYAAIVATDGSVLASAGSPADGMESLEWGRGRGPDGEWNRLQTEEVGEQLVAKYPILRPSGHLAAWSVVTLPLAIAESKAGGMVAMQLLAASTALVIGIGLILVLTSRWIERPLSSLLSAMRSLRFGDGSGAPRFAEAGDGPLSRIADEFNTMARTLRATTVSRDYMESIVASISEALSVVGPDLIIERANPGARRLVGSSESDLLGRPLSDLIRLSEDELPDDLPSACGTGGMEAEIRRADGGTVPVLLSYSRLTQDRTGRNKLVVTTLDLTERKRAEEERCNMEEQLKQSERLQTVGRLAGGVAHEFNNIVTGVMGYCNLMLDGIVPKREYRSTLESIVTLSKRASQISRQLLSFSRATKMQMRDQDLNGILRQTVPMLRTLLGEPVTVELSLHDDPLWIRADRGELEQVLLNLALNARDAMPRGGELRISTGQSNGRVTLEVTDTGLGMEAETLSHIFEPFFTTKEVGHGTGLGLPAVYGAARQHGGEVTVTSEPNRGTTVLIELPETEKPGIMYLPDDEQGPEDRQEPGDEQQYGRVLVVEDEAEVRDITTRFLERDGFEVITAGSGEEALRLVDTVDSLSIVLTDVVMPGMSGPELIERLKERYPNIRAVLISGYPREEIQRQNGYSPQSELIEKPFLAEELTQRLREILAG